MALVQVAFVAGVVLYPDWIGINASPEELEDYIFTWRVFGWYLGASINCVCCTLYGFVLP